MIALEGGTGTNRRMDSANLEEAKQEQETLALEPSGINADADVRGSAAVQAEQPEEDGPAALWQPGSAADLTGALTQLEGLAAADAEHQAANWGGNVAGSDAPPAATDPEPAAAVAAGATEAAVPAGAAVAAGADIDGAAADPAVCTVAAAAAGPGDEQAVASALPGSAAAAEAATSGPAGEATAANADAGDAAPAPEPAAPAAGPPPRGPPPPPPPYAGGSYSGGYYNAYADPYASSYYGTDPYAAAAYFGAGYGYSAAYGYSGAWGLVRPAPSFYLSAAPTRTLSLPQRSVALLRHSIEQACSCAVDCLRVLLGCMPHHANPPE